MAKVKDIVNYILKSYPLSLGSEFDKGKIGLQFGNMEKDVKKVLITLDASNNVVTEAINSRCEMIITHHPFMFSPLLNMSYTSTQGKKMMDVFKNELNIFAMHTNFDTATNGMNDYLLKLIGCTNIRKVVDEELPDNMMRLGDVEEVSLKEFAEKVKVSLKEPVVKVVGDLSKKVKTCAIIGGGGSFEMYQAMRLGVDVYISGEFRHNNMIDAKENNFSLIEVSHYAESNFKPFIKSFLEEEFKDVEFIISETDTIPFTIL